MKNVIKTVLVVILVLGMSSCKSNVADQSEKVITVEMNELDQKYINEADKIVNSILNRELDTSIPYKGYKDTIDMLENIEKKYKIPKIVEEYTLDGDLEILERQYTEKTDEADSVFIRLDEKNEPYFYMREALENNWDHILVYQGIKYEYYSEALEEDGYTWEKYDTQKFPFKVTEHSEEPGNRVSLLYSNSIDKSIVVEFEIIDNKISDVLIEMNI